MVKDDLPAWLAVPLARPDALTAVCQHLQLREQARRQYATAIHQMMIDGRTVDIANLSAKYSVNDGLDKANVRKNRYSDIIAYDRTRFLLNPPIGSKKAHYVNASLVQEPDLGFGCDLQRRWWVASQAPTAETRFTFLSMFLQVPASLASQEEPTTAPSSPMRVIVQLTPLVEQGRAKCHPYFPMNLGEAQCISSTIDGAEDIWMRLVAKTEKNGIRTSNLTLATGSSAQCLSQTAIELVHLEYRGWGDHGVPNDPNHLVSFIRDTLNLNASLAADSANPPPILVGCSAGVGRTGTFITVASLLPLLSKQFAATKSAGPAAPPPLPLLPEDHPLKDYPSDEIEKFGVLPHDYVGFTIDGLREQRTTMVQTPSQIKFCFQALKAAWQQRQ